MVDNCWDMDPEKRANFFELRRALEDLIAASKVQGKSYMDLELAVQKQFQGECMGIHRYCYFSI